MSQNANVWFTSDTHFGHLGIIKLSNRPFANVDEMNEGLIERWNSVVRPGDTVYHLGDFCWRGKTEFEAIFPRLNGIKHLIWGNHDRTVVRNHPGWASSQFGRDRLKVQGQELVLCHYSLRVVPNLKVGTIVLYGHSHGGLPGHHRTVDVGVDCWNWYPVNMDQIKERLATLPEFVPVDHHTFDSEE